ncbi:NUDIX hydrolase [Candidatus Peregrinibacteria bacterium]|jgi:8-oxo-dGTP diphosphatase|nr:NUDIX hydrolase [Candidatus Peregrinibacteria bacterium]
MFFKFCPMCGSDMEMRMAEFDHVERNACSKCKYVNYNNSRPTGTALIFNEQGQILLVKRAWHPFQGFWDTPGGFLEGGEHPEVGTKREMMEELGVEVELEGIFDIVMDEYKDGELESEENVSGYGVPTMNIFYKARIVGGELKKTEEIAGYQWFSLEEVAGMVDQIAFSANRQVIQKLAQG